MQPIKENFGKRFYVFTVILFFIAGALIFTSGVFLDEDYFIKYSPDKTLKESTINSINKFRLILMTFSLIIFICVLILFKNKINAINFMNKRRKSLQNITLLISAILIIFAVSEVALRIAYNETTFAGGYGPGSLKFNRKYVEINKDGMRDRNFDFRKPDGTIRIASVGDSFAFGSGIKNVNNTYSKILESELNDLNNSFNYDVLNFGIMGLSTDDELNLIKNKVLKYNPDIILIGYVSNDFVNIEQIDYKEHFTILPGGFWIRNFFFTYALIELKINRLLENIGFKKNGLSITLEKLNSEKNVKHNKRLFEEINNVSKRHNIKIIVVNFPVIYRLKDYPLQEVNRFISSVSIKNEFVYLDLTPVYEKYSEQDLVVNKYDSHPNELGHKIAAKEILEKLKNEGVV